ncbi:MAG: hypothetical protein ACREUW_11970 [Burkholderiales bacterium]
MNGTASVFPSAALGGIAILLAALALASMTGCMKTDPDSVRGFVKKRITERFAGATINDLSDNGIEVIHPDGVRQILDLESVQATCKQEPRRCGGAADRLLIVMLESIDPSQEPSSPDLLRPVITTREKLGRFLVATAAQETDRAPAEASGTELPYARDLVGDLVVTYYEVRQGTGRPVNAALLRTLKLPASQLDARARQNLERLTTPPTLAPLPGHPGVHYVRSHFLASSELLIPERVAELAAKLRAKDLLIGMPSSNTVFLADAADGNAVEALRKAVDNHYQGYRGALSPQLMLYSRGSWGLYPRAPAARTTTG